MGRIVVDGASQSLAWWCGGMPMARDKATTKDSQTKAGTVGVFISWSGETSRAIAEALSSLIPNIFQDVTAFVSSNDIDAGSNWFGRISAELATTEFGILCLTQDNLAKQWIHFEAGALAKRITDRTRVVPYLHGVTLSDLSPPLSLFHGVNAD
jgi:TIR domain